MRCAPPGSDCDIYYDDYDDLYYDRYDDDYYVDYDEYDAEYYDDDEICTMDQGDLDPHRLIDSLTTICHLAQFILDAQQRIAWLKPILKPRDDVIVIDTLCATPPIVTASMFLSCAGTAQIKEGEKHSISHSSHCVSHKETENRAWQGHIKIVPGKT